MAENLPAKPKYELMALSAHDLFAKVAGEEVWLKEIGFGLQILRGSKLLQEVAATQQGADSIKNSIANVALCGTTLNPVLGKAYLVPRKVHGIMLCCLDMSYKGLAGIAMDSGSVKHLAPRLVYSFEKFEYWEDDGIPHVHHVKELNPPPDFNASSQKFWDYLVCGYLIATMHDDTKIITEPFPKWKLIKAMNTSKTTGDGTPWRTHIDEMCLKTIVKHAYKLLPQTDRMSQAVDVLNQHEGFDSLAEQREKARSIANRFKSSETETVIEAEPGELEISPEEAAEIHRKEMEENPGESGLFED